MKTTGTGAGEPTDKPYREVTVAAATLGILVGVILTASMTYVGLIMGLVVSASAIAAILGWGLLRGVLRRGSIVENNINQTIASGINISSAGVIFTFPALFLMEGATFNVWMIAVATVAGAALGVLFIIPLRKQMIELERLRFPTGVAVAQVLRSPGAGTRKSVLLGTAAVVAFAIGLTSKYGVLPKEIDLGFGLLPAYVPNVWALMLLSVGAGYISGKPGLVVLAGGVLANWLIAPIVIDGLGWIPVPDAMAAGLNAGEITDAAVEQHLAKTVYAEVIRPLGIGFLMGGALAGVALAIPMMGAAFRSMAGAKLGESDELPIRFMYMGAAAAIVLLTVATYFGDPSVGLPRALLTAAIGTLWIWLAGVIVAQCTGMTDWSPISGMALLAVTLILVVVGGGVGVAVLVGAAVCVAIGLGADMMTDQKTGHLVGAVPIRQQLAQLSVSWIGPLVAVVTVYLIWESVGFGAARNPDIPAPQAEVLKSMILAVQGGDVPVDKYVVGGLVSALLTLGTGGGMGVLVGLSMYLPMKYVLPYGLGCLLSIASERRLGRKFYLDTGVPVAAGLLVGDSLSGVVFATLKLLSSMGGGS